MKEDLALNWSQDVAPSHKDEEIASTAVFLSLGYVVCFDTGSEAQQSGWRRGSDQVRVSEESCGTGCTDT